MHKFHLSHAILDFNGTLFRDETFHEQAWEIMGERLGRPIAEGEIGKKVLGFTNKAIFAYLLGDGLLDEKVRELSEEKEQIYRDLCIASKGQCSLAPGAETFLDDLKALRIPMTLATASIKSNVRFFFEIFDLRRWFQFEKVSFDDGVLRGKPFPDLFLAAASHIGAAMPRTLVAEDSRGGIQAAVAARAGFVVAIAPNEQLSRFDGVDGPNLVISDFSEIDRNLFSAES